MNAKNRMLKQNSLSFGSSDTDTTWLQCQLDLANLRKTKKKNTKNTVTAPCARAPSKK